MKRVGRPEWLDLAINVMAVHRLVRLVTADDLTAGVRDAIIRAAYAGKGRESATRSAMVTAGLEPSIPGAWTDWITQREKDPPSLGTLISCRWCCSVWCAFGVIVARRFLPRAWRPVATALALSSASTLLAGLEQH